MMDQRFDALRNEYRRQVLIGLLERDSLGVSTLSKLSEDDLSEREARIRNHHLHLPKLATNGFIEWDRDRGIVRKGPQFDEIRPLLERFDEARLDLVID